MREGSIIQEKSSNDFRGRLFVKSLYTCRSKLLYGGTNRLQFGTYELDFLQFTYKYTEILHKRKTFCNS